MANRRRALGQALQQGGRKAARKFSRALDAHLVKASKRIGALPAVSEHSARQVADALSREFGRQAERLLHETRQSARQAASLALAGAVTVYAASEYSSPDRQRGAEYSSKLLEQVKSAIVTAALAWVALGRTSPPPLRNDRRITAALERTLLTENADAFSDQLRRTAERNGDTDRWVWDAHLEACPVCRARHGRRISQVGWPPAHPRCECFPAPADLTLRGSSSGRGGGGRGPGVPYRPNPPGTPPRTIDDLERLARENGIDLDWDDEPILFVVAPTPDSYASYANWPAPPEHLRVDPRTEMLRLTRNRFEQIIVNIDPSTMLSDDAIVGTVAHEMHELKELVVEFERRGGSISRTELDSLVNGHTGKLHLRAYDYSDEVVRKRQAREP